MNVLRRTWAEIHLNRLRNNVYSIRDTLSPGCRMMAMVKADAYGHGAVPVAKVMADYGVDWFGVSNLEEAIQLRAAGISQPILIVSYTPPEEAVRLAEYHITQAVVSTEHGVALNEKAVAAGVQLAVHVKVDTGMSRVGIPCYDAASVDAAASAIAAICRLPALQAEGIFTHFASADEQEDDGFTAGQFELFTAVIDNLKRQGISFPLRHCCNSAATLRFPKYHLDMVRPGIILYGLMPSAWMGKAYPDFQPVMELKSTVSMVKSTPPHRPVSYNRTYSTATATRLATVAIGYGDGCSRLMSNRGHMLVAGGTAPVVGRICMDQCMLDVTALPQVKAGDVVTVFGSDGDRVLPADDIAAWMGTINYEVVCLVGRRVPRLYVEDGQATTILNYIIP